MLLVWFSCLLSLSLLVNVVLLSHAVSCQEAAASAAQEQQRQQPTEEAVIIDASWFPGEKQQESNQDFVKRITIGGQEADETRAPKMKWNDHDEKAAEPLDLFGLFDGKAQNPENDAFVKISNFFHNLADGVDPFGGEREGETAAEGEQSTNDILDDFGLSWLVNGVQQLSTNPDRQVDEWWTHLQKGVSQREKFLTGLFLQATDNDAERKEGFMDTLRVFSEAFDEVQVQMNETFGEVNFLAHASIIQFLFFMDHEEAVKNAVWKRRAHRHYRSLTAEEAQDLYPGLFLSQLSYTTSCLEIHKYTQQLGAFEWALRNCTVESKPHEPAHFLGVRKLHTTMPDLGPFNFLNGPIRAMRASLDMLHVVLVVRGTKDLGDILTDPVLKAAPYRGGLAHDGIQRAALWLFETYKDDLHRLLKASGRKKMKLWIVGHSLGAGTAALTAIEFLECCSKWVDAEAIGFGSPAVLSPELSAKYRNAITTIITDADCVPRMSGPTLVNAWRRIVTHDHGDDVLMEFDHLMRVMQSNLPTGGLQSLAANVVKDLRNFILDKVENGLRPKIAQALQSNMPVRVPELVPPGECIHIYRDGTAWQGTYINCTFFDELDTVWHAVEDHLIPVRT